MKRLLVISVIASLAAAATYWVWVHPHTESSVTPKPMTGGGAETVSNDDPFVAITEQVKTEAGVEEVVLEDRTGGERRVIRVKPYELEDLDALASLLGVDSNTLREEITGWMESHGMPPDEMGELISFHLDQPYDQYDDTVLLGLAENGDMWAMQMVADKLRKERPVEALEWYRRAALAGSVSAMIHIGDLYRQLSSQEGETYFDGNEEGLRQFYALSDSTESMRITSVAWSTAGAMAGRFTAGEVFMGFGSRVLDDEEHAQACQMAESIYEDINAERQAMGYGLLDTSPFPFLIESSVFGDAGSLCASASHPPIDTSACIEIQLDEGRDEMFTGWYCGSQN